MVLVALGLSAGCAADADGGDVADSDLTTTAPTTSVPPAAASETPSTTVPASSSVTVVVAAGDEVYLDTSSGQLIHRDGAGAYICVLRRGDDLADLRAGFTGSDGPPTEAS